MILRRLFAFLIDKIIIGILLSLTIAFVKDTIIEIALFFIISGFYFSYLESSKIQASIGKILLDLKVVHQDGTTLKGSEAFIRFIAFYVINLTGILFVISVIMMIFREDGKMLHDLVFDTQVVKS